jgi:hypothetical protein
MAKGKADFKIGNGKLINHTSITDSEFAYLLTFFEKAFGIIHFHSKIFKTFSRADLNSFAD